MWSTTARRAKADVSYKNGGTARDIFRPVETCGAVDGTPLRILLYTPAGDGPFPVVIVRSPYTGQRGSGMAWLARRE